MLAAGMVTAVLGLILVFAPGAGILGLLSLVAAFAIVAGILLIAYGVQIGGSGRSIGIIRAR